MARVPFFLSTWQRKAKFTAVLVGAYLALRGLAALSDATVELGWSDIPVSVLFLIYAALAYIELWIVLERHTRPFLSVLAAAVLAALCLVSPFLDFDPVATGSIPDRQRFWEPTLGVERSPGQRLVYLERSFLDQAVDEAAEASERARGDLLSALGLPEEAGELSHAETDALMSALRGQAAALGLAPVRARLYAVAATAKLEMARSEYVEALLEPRLSCLSAALALREEPATDRAPGELPEECDEAPSPWIVATLDAETVKPLAEAGATPSFLDAVEERVDAWLEAPAAAPPATEGAPVLRLGPAEDGRSRLLERAAELSRPPAEGASTPDLEALQQRLTAYSAALGRWRRSRQEVGILQAQLDLIPEQIRGGLRTLASAGDGPAEWTLVESAALQQTLDEQSSGQLERWINPRSRVVLDYARALPGAQAQQQFLHYLAQTQHWHLRDPNRILKRLEQTEEDERPSARLGAVDLAPVTLCKALEANGLDAALLQLAGADRQGTQRLRLSLVQRHPCLVVWEHEVPIYSQADVLGGTADDGAALSAAAAEFFAPYPLGTDYLGRDMLSRLVKGTEGFFLPGLLAVLIGLGLGVLLGAVAGYVGGRTDRAITFLTTVVGSFPRLVFILLACTIPDEPSMTMIGGITGALFIPQVAEAVRRRVLALKAEDFILASRAHGLSLPRILFYHIVWLQCFPEIVRQALYLFVYVIFLETALSYLEGPGAPPEVPSWGRMLANATAAMFRGQYWHALVPTAAIVFTTLGVASLGDVIVGQAKEERL